MNKKITIIIPCLNEEQYISECLNSIIITDYPNEFLEVIVVDGISIDNTRKIIQKYIDRFHFIKLIDNIKKTPPTAMNLGIKIAKGDYICRLDAHAKYPSNYLSILLKYSEQLNAQNVGAVCITDVKNKNFKSNSIKKVLSHKLGVGNSDFRIGVSEIKDVDTVPFGFYKKEVFSKYGLYDERLIRNQDIELNRRIKNNGGKIYLIPEVKCTYFARENFINLAKNNFNNGKWNILTAYYTQTLRSLSLRHFIPLLYVLSLIIPMLLSMLVYNKMIFISIFLFLLHFLVICFVSYKINDKSTSILNLIKSFYTLHFSYGLGSLKGIVDVIFKIIKKEKN